MKHFIRYFLQTQERDDRSSQHFASFQSEPYAIARAAEDDDYETMNSDSSRSQESLESDEADDFPQDDRVIIQFKSFG